MIIQVQFTPDEIKDFFQQHRFHVIKGTFGKWGPAYHNRSEWNDYIADAVLIKNKYVEASKLFEKVAEKRLKQLIAPSSNEMRELIENTFNELI